MAPASPCATAACSASRIDVPASGSGVMPKYRPRVSASPHAPPASRREAARASAEQQATSEPGDHCLTLGFVVRALAVVTTTVLVTGPDRVLAAGWCFAAAAFVLAGAVRTPPSVIPAGELDEACLAGFAAACFVLLPACFAVPVEPVGPGFFTVAPGPCFLGRDHLTVWGGRVSYSVDRKS